MHRFQMGSTGQMMYSFTHTVFFRDEKKTNIVCLL